MKQTVSELMKEGTRSTRWEDTTGNTLDEIIEKLSSIPENNNDNACTRYLDWEVDKIFESNINIELSGQKIEYNAFKFSFTYVPVGYQKDDDVSSIKTGFIIVYKSKGKIRYIIDKNSDALSMLRKKLSYTGRSEVRRDTYPFKKYHFIWLIGKIYIGNNILEGSEGLNDLSICTIRGFKGDTENSLATIKAEGEDVIKSLSTSCFLIESDKLDQISMEMEYKHYKNISVKLMNKTINLLTNRCLGVSSDKDIFELILTLYIEIVPIIIQNYDNEVSSGQWNEEKYTEFLKRVAEDVNTGIKSKLKISTGEE